MFGLFLAFTIIGTKEPALLPSVYLQGQSRRGTGPRWMPGVRFIRSYGSTTSRSVERATGDSICENMPRPREARLPITYRTSAFRR
ncbi:hypothetical protein BGZ57DRAFT_910926 [Hyaloscypha finlandica]|nr:hypothetical protein BGZ57DRAFT_910926 [Hyaloscypha finlandica]